MSETKFTPGPWDFEPSGKEAGYIGFPDGSGFYAAIREDDGHLIAASPDLYAALENLLKYSHPSPGQEELYQDGWEVLAKARGEADQ